MKTKEQEQKALDQIKKILADFGPDTYLGIAFEGVLEDAQENIDNDWGCSMKQRYKKAFEDGEEAAKEAKRAKEDLKKAQAKVLPVDIMSKMLTIVIHHQTVLQEKAKEQAEKIVEMADDPTQPDFKSTVKRHRGTLAAIKEAEEIMDAITHTEQ